MNITAVTRYKHGELYAILQRLGWTQSELARRAGVSPTLIGEIINLVRRPSRQIADAIQLAIGEAGQYLDVLQTWPETFAGLKRGYKREQTVDVPLERLIDHPEILQLAAPEEGNDFMQSEALEALMGDLPKKSQIVLRERFWNGATLGEAGRKIGHDAERARQIEQKAIRVLGDMARRNKAVNEALGTDKPELEPIDL